MRERIVQRKNSARRDMNLFVLAVHRRISTAAADAPAAQGTEPPNVGAIVDARYAAVAFADTVTFGMGRPSLRRFAMVSAVGRQPLRDIEAAAVAFDRPRTAVSLARLTACEILSACGLS